jgi:hypothetical protein
MKFSGYLINGVVSFDYEAFPDNSGAPDFTFMAKDNTNTVVSNWTVDGVTPGTTDGTAKHSPNHQGTGNTNLETNKQYIGTWSSKPLSNVTELDFIDWPATIAIDNLTISKVPEPGTMLLLGTGLAGLFFLKKKQRA